MNGGLNCRVQMRSASSTSNSEIFFIPSEELCQQNRVLKLYIYDKVRTFQGVNSMADKECEL